MNQTGIDMAALAQQVNHGLAGIEPALAWLVSVVLGLVGLGVLIGLAGRIRAYIAWRWADWLCDRRDAYTWELRRALARMQGLGLRADVVIELALKEARTKAGPLRSQIGLPRGLLHRG